MRERFANPPLVELVAELRWTDPSVQPFTLPAGFPADFPFPILDPEGFERQLSILHSAMASIGYGASERLVPAGFPLPGDAPIVRYRYSGADAEQSGREHLPSTLFQIGRNIFTANAVQPYKSWDEFRSIVERGIKVLLNSHKEKSYKYSLQLRYIDLFTPEFTDQKSHLQFISDVLGFNIGVPDALAKHARHPGIDVPALQVTIPLDFGSLRIQMAEGKMANKSGFIFESVLVIDQQADADVEQIMKSFSRGRDVIHEVFVSITSKISERMMPIEEKS